MNFSLSHKLGFLLFFLIPLIVVSQKKINTKFFLNINEQVPESSGLTFNSKGDLITINDSGSEATFYIYSDNSDSLTRVFNPDIVNVDWEEIQFSNNRFIVADIGNNANLRKDLAFYYLDTTFHLMSKQEFKYETQKQFPPDSKNKMYDAEAFIELNDTLLIFTKNRKDNFDGVSWVFSLAKNDSIAYYEGKIQLQEKKRIFNWVTGAYHSTDNLYLLSSKSIYVLDSIFLIRDIFKVEPKQYQFQALKQREAIAVYQNKIYVSNEKRLLQKAKISTIKLLD